MRIAFFFFCYNMANGVLVMYLPAYFRGLNLNGERIAAIAVLSNVALIFVPPVWGIISDRTQRPAKLLKLACAMAGLAFIPMLWAATFPQIMGVMAVYTILLSPITTLADTVAVCEARRLGTDYGRLRLWGTIGYIVSVLSFGLWLTRGGKFQDVPLVGMGAIALYMLAALFNPESPIDLHRKPPSLRDAGRLLAEPAFLVFLLAQLVHWMALQPFYMLFTIHLTDLNVRDWASVSVAVSAATEVILFFSFGAICRRVPILLLMGIAGAVSSFRWFCDSNIHSGPAFVAVQALHCFSFGACYAGSIVYMERTVPPQLLATGRALFSSLVLGLGGVLGVLLAGALYDAGNGKFGGGMLAFRSAGFLDLYTPVLLFVAWRLAAKKATREAPVVVADAAIG